MGLAVLGLAPGGCDAKPVEERAFDGGEWRRGDETERRTMVGDLLARELLAGMERARVSEILGPPDQEMRSLTFRVGEDERVAVFFDRDWSVHEVRAMGFGGESAISGTPFDEEAWSEAGPATRLGMARDLASGGDLVGRSRKEVVDLLGSPVVKTDAALYDLGADDLLDASVQTLWVYFDEEGKVEKALAP